MNEQIKEMCFKHAMDYSAFKKEENLVICYKKDELYTK